ncbi:unnamed protein product [Leuciscus chuanchicus]
MVLLYPGSQSKASLSSFLKGEWAGDVNGMDLSSALTGSTASPGLVLSINRQRQMACPADGGDRRPRERPHSYPHPNGKQRRMETYNADDATMSTVCKHSHI